MFSRVSKKAPSKTSLVSLGMSSDSMSIGSGPASPKTSETLSQIPVGSLGSSGGPPGGIHKGDLHAAIQTVRGVGNTSVKITVFLEGDDASLFSTPWSNKGEEQSWPFAQVATTRVMADNNGALLFQVFVQGKMSQKKKFGEVRLSIADAVAQGSAPRWLDIEADSSGGGGSSGASAAGSMRLKQGIQQNPPQIAVKFLFMSKSVGTAAAAFTARRKKLLEAPLPEKITETVKGLRDPVKGAPSSATASPPGMGRSPAAGSNGSPQAITGFGSMSVPQLRNVGSAGQFNFSGDLNPESLRGSSASSTGDPSNRRSSAAIRGLKLLAGKEEVIKSLGKQPRAADSDDDEDSPTNMYKQVDAGGNDDDDDGGNNVGNMYKQVDAGDDGDGDGEAVNMYKQMEAGDDDDQPSPPPLPLSASPRKPKLVMAPVLAVSDSPPPSPPPKKAFASTPHPPSANNNSNKSGASRKASGWGSGDDSDEDDGGNMYRPVDSQALRNDDNDGAGDNADDGDDAAAFYRAVDVPAPTAPRSRPISSPRAVPSLTSSGRRSRNSGRKSGNNSDVSDDDNDQGSARGSAAAAANMYMQVDVPDDESPRSGGSGKRGSPLPPTLKRTSTPAIGVPAQKQPAAVSASVPSSSSSAGSLPPRKPLPKPVESSDDEETIKPLRGKGKSSPRMDASEIEVEMEQVIEEVLPVQARGRASSLMTRLTRVKEEWRDMDSFNARFQEAVETMNLHGAQSNTRRMELINSCLTVIRLAQDFATLASQYGKTIISEHALPENKRTIKPRKDLGGVLGGEKFIVLGILFKFASDEKGLFKNLPDPLEAANKIAGLELKGLKCYFSTRTPNLSFPLMALIDYKGYRLVAMSVLPIDKNTLKYGSSDAGRNIFMEDDDLTQLIREASLQLNLKPHMVGPKGKEVEMVSAADLEGHVGYDGRFYMLDFSRAMPPVHTGVKDRPDHLYQQFRAEFMRSHTPLSPDACSMFGRHNASVHDKEIVEATAYLKTTHIPEITRKLVVDAEEAPDITSFSLSEALHRRGVNMRYLGLVYQQLQKYHTENRLRDITLIEMCARVLKNKLRSRMRNVLKTLKDPSEAPFNNLVMEEYNVIFGQNVETYALWNDYVFKKLVENFSVNAADLPEDLNGYMRQLVYNSKGRRISGKWLLMVRVSNMTGVEIDPNVIEQLQQEPKMFDRAEVLDYLDVVGLRERVKHLNIINHAKGEFYYLRGLGRHNHSSSIEYFEKAERCLEDALQSSPTDPQLLSSMGNILFEHAKKSVMANAHDPQVNSNLQRAKQYFLSAIRYDSTNFLIFRDYAMFLEHIEDLDGAEDYYLKSLSLNPNQMEGLRRYGQFLRTFRGDPEAAAAFFDRYKVICELFAEGLGDKSIALSPRPSAPTQGQQAMSASAALQMLQKDKRDPPPRSSPSPNMVGSAPSSSPGPGSPPIPKSAPAPIVGVTAVPSAPKFSSHRSTVVAGKGSKIEKLGESGVISTNK